MGWYTHINTCFSAEDCDVSREIARRHMRTEDVCREFDWMLDAFATGKGFFVGPKGSLFNWGIVGNYTSIDAFIARMVPFLEDLRACAEDTEFFGHEHALVFFEPEQSESAQCYEIMPQSDDDDESPLIVRHHGNLKFAWMQM